MNRRRLAALATTGLLIATTSLLPATEAEAQTVLSASGNTPSHFIHKVMLVDWAADVEKATQGRVKVNVLPKAVANFPGAYDAVRDGLADVAYVLHGFTPTRFPLTAMVELPFSTTTSEEVSIAYWRTFNKHLAKAGEHKGTKVLTVFVHGPGHLYNAKRAVATAADMKGLKVRVGAGTANEVAKRLDMVPLQKPSGESYELLSSGIADGILFPAESILGFKLEKIVRHETEFPGGLYNTSFALVMNEAAWNKLPKADQDAVMTVSGEALARRMGRAWDDNDRLARAQLQAAGVQKVRADPALMKAVGERLKDLEGTWVKAADAKGVAGAQVLADFRAEVKRVGAGQ